MQTITVEYLRRLGACWPESKLRDAAKSWPSPTTWAWFLGDRLGGMHRGEQLERVHVALAHVAFQKISLPVSPGQIAAIAKTCGQPELLAMSDALGAVLDSEPDPDHPESYGNLIEELHDAIVTARASGIIEAKP